MKHLCRLIVISAAIFAVSCASTGDVQMPEEEAPAIEQVKHEEPVYETVYIPVIMMETTVFDGDFIRSTREYMYEDTQLQRIIERDTYGDIIEEYRYLYDDGGTEPVRVDKINSEGNISGYTIFEYNSDGQPVIERSYDEEDSPLLGNRYTYNIDGNRIEWEVLDEAGMVISITKYYFDEDKLIKIENLNPAGEIQEYYEISYSGGLKDRKTYYGQTGVVMGSEEYAHIDGALAKTDFKRANGSVKRTETYEYDEYGSVASVKIIDAAGSLREEVIYEYSYREETREVTEE